MGRFHRRDLDVCDHVGREECVRFVAPGKPSPNDAGRKPPATAARASKGKKRSEDLDELFVDPAPPPGDGKRSGRAADRRRERGQGPQPAGGPDTRTSMKQKSKDPDPAAASRSMSAAPGVATLTCARGPEEGLTLQLMEGSYTIGRARENSFVLKDIAASRRHVRIDVDARGARMTDLGSGNGSRLNGRRVSEAELRHGDRIEIGGSVLVFAEAGRERPGAAPTTDEAQDRVIRAAEKLAAELSERMRFGEGPQGHFEDGHIARTRALPATDKAQIHDELQRQAALQKQSGKKLWNETLSNLPLNEIIPADDPLRGSRAMTQSPPPPAYAPPVRVRQPPPRPIAPPEDFEPSFSESRGAGSSWLLALVVSALVVILGGAAVLGVYWVTQRDGKSARDAKAPDAEPQKLYEEARDGAERSMLLEDWPRVLEYATLALQHKPADPTAQRYQAKAREKLLALTQQAAAQQPPVAPPSAAPPAAPPPGVVQPTAAQPAAAQPAPAQPAPAQPAAAQPAAAPKPREATAPRESPPKPRSAPAGATPAPKKPAKGKKMTDGQAKDAFSEAVDLLRNKEDDEGCDLLERVARDAPAESVWRGKAEGLLERRCD